MAVEKKTAMSRRLVDHVQDELVNALSEDASFEFKEIFARVFEGLKRKNAVSGGEEMLRLRCYEKLQQLMRDGLVKKNGKSYRALKGIERTTTASRLERLTAKVR